MKNVYKTYEHFFNYFKSNTDVTTLKDLQRRIKDYQPEILEEDVVSYKALYLTNLNKPWFEGLNRGSYGVSAKFDCPTHNFPDLNCTCGFHSYKSFESALRESSMRFGTVVAEIINYGDIIEHDLGYRSEEQEIRKLYISKKCSRLFCKKLIKNFTRNKNLIVARCEKHTGVESYPIEALKLPYEIL